MRASKGQLFVGLAGVALVVGFFLPWLDVGGVFRASGFDALRASHGWSLQDVMMLAIPVGGALMAILSVTKPAAARKVSLGVGLGLVGYGTVKTAQAFFLTTGWGLWIVMAAALVALVVPLFWRAKRD
jgi:hypothetical protein